MSNLFLYEKNLDELTCSDLYADANWLRRAISLEKEHLNRFNGAKNFNAQIHIDSIKNYEEELELVLGLLAKKQLSSCTWDIKRPKYHPPEPAREGHIDKEPITE